MLECRKHAEQRKKPRLEVPEGRLTVDRLLRCPSNIKHTVKYVSSTEAMNAIQHRKMASIVEWPQR